VSSWLFGSLDPVIHQSTKMVANRHHRHRLLTLLLSLFVTIVVAGRDFYAIVSYIILCIIKPSSVAACTLTHTFELKQLGVERGASVNDIRRSFKKKALLMHPDKNLVIFVSVI
jgi:hypothetical protein